MALGAMCVAGGYADHVLTVTSSHFASAEKQFRYPLEYANQRPVSATWTVTGSGAYILGTKKSDIKITGLTPGRIVDYGVRDSMNMELPWRGGVDTIYHHFCDFGTKPEDYDKIITGVSGMWDRRF